MSLSRLSFPPVIRSVSQTAATALALALGLPLAAQAITYNKWTAVAAPTGSGASCGNGSTYHYFVNRAPLTRKTLIYFEGGGACWNQHDCLGKGKFSEVASNPNGVPENYLSQLNLAAFGLISPMIWRTSPLDKTATQSWNIVYVPYCTGDVHAGSAVQVYKDADPAKPLTYYHRGHANIKEVARWVKANIPTDEMLLSGFSAGSTGATASYVTLRDTIQPRKSSLLSDAGPLFPAPRGASATDYPSLPLHSVIRGQWGLDRNDGGVIAELLARHPEAQAIRDDLGSLNTELARLYPQDRFGYALMQQDGVYSSFSYRLFYPELAALQGQERDEALNKLWLKDVAHWTAELQKSPNVGYYVPFFRPLIKSHTLTTLDFSGTGIEEANLASVNTFIDNVLDRRALPIRAVEQDHVSDYYRPVDGIQWLVFLVQDFFV